jgi:hypothetical protein
MPASEQRSLDEIWDGDLFGRQEEAQHLIGYIESVMARSSPRQDKRAFTIAVDAPYGEGKSFFLKRLAENMSANHPVAFVDAWADDLADEPLTALAATLKRALEPFIDAPEMQTRLNTFMAKTGQVAKIASLGLLRRGIGLAITGGAVDAAADILTGVSKDVADAVNDGIKDASLAQVEEVGQAIRGVSSHALMDQRVSDFEDGQAAVHEMKRSLEAIVSTLGRAAKHPPIVIFIDELDRCRPTYAVKLLEEIKHLFDVPGLVFLLAMNGDQLAYSVTGAYGPGFNGRAYLRRFIDREYRLAEPGLHPLITKLCADAGIADQNVRFPLTAHTGGGRVPLDFAAVIAEYMRLYGLSARDAFALIDNLQTCVALTPGQRLEGAYLIPLLAGALIGLPSEQIPIEKKIEKYCYYKPLDPFHRDTVQQSFAQVADEFRLASHMSEREIADAYSQENQSFGVAAIGNTRAWNVNPLPLWDVASYPRLVRTVGRFTNPSLTTTDTALPPQARWIS